VLLQLRRTTGSLRGLPDLLIIGAQRCGTTSLGQYLRAHPQVRSGLVKEIQFFTDHWSRGVGWYRAHFPISPGQSSLLFEATPAYLFHPLAPERAAAVVPDARLIVLLRDPVERAVSHYRHSVRLGHESLDLVAALDAEPERMADEYRKLAADPNHSSRSLRAFSYTERGRYAEQLERWLECYRREQLLVLFSEEMFADPAACYRQALDFLGLPLGAMPEFKVFTKKAGGDTAVPDAVRSRLHEVFAPEDARLERLLGRPLPWRTASAAMGEP
jgi:hypothetical protein